MGQQADVTWRLIHLFAHKNAPLVVDFEYYTMSGGKKLSDKPAFTENVAAMARADIPGDSFWYKNALWAVANDICASFNAALLEDFSHLY